MNTTQMAPPPAMRRLGYRTVAVGSGKGGVGKSTTVINLSLFYSRQGMRVGLIDLDPLSNILTILDVEEPQRQASIDPSDSDISLNALTKPLFSNLEILLPRALSDRFDSTLARRLLFGRFADELERRYDILLLDLPAGINREENLSFLPYIAHLLVVTHPEPSAHVSAGGYIRAALETAPHLRIWLWHNRFVFAPGVSYSPGGVIETYHRFVVDDDLRFSPEMQRRCRNLAYIPHDEALDLLQTRFSIGASVRHKIRGIVQALIEVLTPAVPVTDDLPARSVEFIRYHIYRHPVINDPQRYTAEICDHLASLKAAGIIDSLPNEVQREQIGAYIGSLFDDPLYRRLSDLLHLLESAIEEDVGQRQGRRIESCIVSLLRLLQGHPLLAKPDVRNSAGILLFYLAMHKLMRIERIETLIRSVVPVRIDKRGRRMRDRHAQIRSLVQNDPQFRRRYVELIQMLFPFAVRQISTIVRRFSLQKLLLRDREGKPHRAAYLKLLNLLTHDAINGGLGIVVNIGTSPVYRALSEGAQRLLHIVRSIDSTP